MSRNVLFLTHLEALAQSAMLFWMELLIAQLFCNAISAVCVKQSARKTSIYQMLFWNREDKTTTRHSRLIQHTNGSVTMNDEATPNSFPSITSPRDAQQYFSLVAPLVPQNRTPPNRCTNFYNPKKRAWGSYSIVAINPVMILAAQIISTQNLPS